MTKNAQTVACFLANGGELRTRLRERLDGDIHDYPFLLPPILCSLLDPGDLIPALEELEQCSVAVRCEIVHSYDSAEYLVTWRSARRRRGPPFLFLSAAETRLSIGTMFSQQFFSRSQMSQRRTL